MSETDMNNNENIQMEQESISFSARLYTADRQLVQNYLYVKNAFCSYEGAVVSTNWDEEDLVVDSLAFARFIISGDQLFFYTIYEPSSEVAKRYHLETTIRSQYLRTPTFIVIDNDDDVARAYEVIDTYMFEKGKAKSNYHQDETIESIPSMTMEECFKFGLATKQLVDVPKQAEQPEPAETDVTADYAEPENYAEEPVEVEKSEEIEETEETAESDVAIPEEQPEEQPVEQTEEQTEAQAEEQPEEQPRPEKIVEIKPATEEEILAASRARIEADRQRLEAERAKLEEEERQQLLKEEQLAAQRAAEEEARKRAEEEKRLLEEKIRKEEERKALEEAARIAEEEAAKKREQEKQDRLEAERKAVEEANRIAAEREEEAKRVFNEANMKKIEVVEQLEEDPEYAEILKDLNIGNGFVKYKKEYFLRAIDEEWVEFIERVIPIIWKLIKNPRTFLAEEGIILPTSVSKKVTPKSIRHLNEHAEFVQSVKPNGDIVPEKILNIFTEDSPLTYENKFLNTLILRLFVFVNGRYEIVRREVSDELKTSLTLSQAFTHPNLSISGKVYFHMEVSEPPEGTVNLKNRTYSTEIWDRVKALNTEVVNLINSKFCKELGKNYIKPPVMRTNVILKNKDFFQCLQLWQFLESYENIGYELLVQSDLVTPGVDLIKKTFNNISSSYLSLIEQVHGKNSQEAEAIDSLFSEEVMLPKMREKLDRDKDSVNEDGSYDMEWSAKAGYHPSPRPKRYRSRKMTATEKTIEEAIKIAILADIRMQKHMAVPEDTEELVLEINTKETNDTEEINITETNEERN